MQRCYYFHRNQKFCNGIPQIKSFECTLDKTKWGDVRSIIEESLGISRVLTAQGKKKYDSLFGCVVANQRSHRNWCKLFEESSSSNTNSGSSVEKEFMQLSEISKLLPPLEKGSLLVDGDLIMIAIVPYKQILYFEDIWHRYWLYCLMQKHFAARNQAEQFENDIRRYNLKMLTCRVIALAKSNDIKTIKKDFNQAFQHYVVEKKENSLFEFGSACSPPFGVEIYKKMCLALQNICIEFDWRTRFFTKLIRESGGAIEYGNVVAKRLGLEDIKLAQLVRDVTHNYEPLYIIKEAKSEESLENKMEEEKVEEMPLKKRKVEETIEKVIHVDDMKTEPVKKEVAIDYLVEEQDEETKIQQVINGANETCPNLIHHSVKIYCVCCDVPGHHTLLCPRLDFFENLRIGVSESTFAIPEYHFYAPQNGICPIPNSLLSKYLNRNKPTLAGHINRKNQKVVAKDCSLPPLPYYVDVRWSIDT